MIYLYRSISVVLAWILDKIFGDPINLPHPVVLFGNIISFFEKRLNKGSNKALKGGIMAICLILLSFAATWAILHHAFILNWWCGFILSIIGIYFCLAGKTLIKEVKMVFEALNVSLEKGRVQVGRIVGRDTSNLSAQEIKAAALETLAENLSDGVIAPLFWFLIAGIPGMFAYKMANTLDSMIAYKNEKYLKYGMVAAKIDDVLNYIPARLTALLMIAVAPSKIGKNCSFSKKLRFIKKYAHEHASPNSGFPESALASILDCRFGGTHSYFGEEVYKPFIGNNPREFTFEDMKIATKVNCHSEILMLLIILLTQTALYFL